ncbi:class II aldolase/adducin family protein [Ochrobactrum sp. C6C9]|uniref:class II aldolase/adducin family protein n=1 Tax=Ochrobactrum sp. C6C9 TaxID=2736662 RepID=UPI0035304157|nr:class II aldolase/adducin family protein [Ochrobactrum sp. C6C9]
MTLNSNIGNEWQKKDEATLRIELAAAFRLAVLNDWHESVSNHFSLALSDDGRRFLMNPRWRHFSRVKSSDLLGRKLIKLLGI